MTDKEAIEVLKELLKEAKRQLLTIQEKFIGVSDSIHNRLQQEQEKIIATYEYAISALEKEPITMKKLIEIMTEQWQVRDMIHGSIINEKRRDRMIKLLAQAIIDKFGR